MAKSDRPLDEIDTERAKSQLGSPTFAGDTDVNALDFETANGDPFMLAVDRDDGTSQIYPSDGPADTAMSGSEIFGILTNRNFRNCLNFWYNMDFDANAMLKFLPETQLKRLNKTNTARFDPDSRETEYEITYFPGKFLKIKDGNDNTYSFYDISQFDYCGSLDDAADTWLDESKAGDDLDVGGEAWDASIDADGEITGYVRDNWRKIAKYALKDVDLTRRLAKEIIRVAENEIDPAIPFGRPLSTGYVAADYLRNRLDYAPTYSRDAVQSLAWEAYAGGRFEVFERGAVGEVAGPDINSAYPAVMADLPDPGTLAWKRTDDVDDLREADYGFVKFRGTTDESRRIQPFAVKNSNHDRVEFPALDDAVTTCIAPIFLFAIDADYLQDFEIIEAWAGTETDATKRPFSWVDDLYNTRKCYENPEAPGPHNPKVAKLIKIVLNSMYGKTCQTNPDYQPLFDEDSPVSPPVKPSDVGNNLKDSVKVVTDMDGQPLLERLEAGSFFNPILASYITGMTRLKLHEATVNAGLESDAVMFATDCLMIRRDAFAGTDLEARSDADPTPGEYDKALGGWDYDYKGRAFLIGSGIYEVEKESGDYKRGVRGFKDLGSWLRKTGDSLRDKAEAADGDEIEIPNERPLTYGDALTTNKISLTDVCRFYESERGLRSDMDGKRDWDADAPDYDDLTAGAEGSEPKVLTDGDWSG